MKRAAWCLPLLLSACAGPQQSALDPGGSHAQGTANLWWFFSVLLGIIFLLVFGAWLVPLFRRNRGVDSQLLEQTHRPPAATEWTLAKRVGAASGVTVLILFGLLVASIVTGHAVSQPQSRANGMVVEVTGNQWWWYVRYLNDDASRIVVTANEIHIPVGRPVLIRETSNDVIHSFWVPGLQGKTDLIPSRVTTQWIEANQAGRFRGQCAEFCGLQHAHMALWVVAEPEDKFESWMNNQLKTAVPPSTPDQVQGQQIFLNHACVLCHTISGTTAAGQVAPDLSHLASRFTIAAGTLPNTKGNLAGWIGDPQAVKPGNHMATLPLRSEEVQPLVDYLESLQ
ncbi:MAG TPA: cytochrome c oxidase subunit II [Bryobacteraceae bacterium]|nr:cytochrome c oxidase subunit II [Bryobacteraceae bacterium]